MWTEPRTWVVGELVTAAMLNTHLRDSVSFLAGTDVDMVTPAEATTSTSFTDLATAGPSVSVVTGTKALVHLSAELTALGNFANMSFEVSGASTLAAAISRSLQFAHVATGYVVQIGTSVFVDGLTAGPNVFTAKYASPGGASVSFGNRRIAVVPLP